MCYSDGPGKPVAKGKEFLLAEAIVTMKLGSEIEFVVATTLVDGKEKELVLRSPNGPSDAAAWVAAIEATPGTVAESKLLKSFCAFVLLAHHCAFLPTCLTPLQSR